MISGQPQYKEIMKLNKLGIILISCVITCGSPQDEPNIRTQPGIEYCGSACSKMQKMLEEGDTSCEAYIETIIVDNKQMNCQEFCEYEMNNSVQLNPKCIYEQVNSCTEIPEKCED